MLESLECDKISSLFQPPHPDLQHGLIISYSIGYRLANSSEPFRYITVDARDPNVNNFFVLLSNSREIRLYFSADPFKATN